MYVHIFIVTKVQKNGLHVLLSPRAEGFVPLMRISNSPEVSEGKKRNFFFFATKKSVVTVAIVCVSAGVDECKEMFL